MTMIARPENNNFPNIRMLYGGHPHPDHPTGVAALFYTTDRKGHRHFILQLRGRTLSAYPEHYGPVGGWVEPGETWCHALAREVHEEMGTPFFMEVICGLLRAQPTAVSTFNHRGRAAQSLIWMMEISSIAARSAIPVGQTEEVTAVAHVPEQVLLSAERFEGRKVVPYLRDIVTALHREGVFGPSSLPSRPPAANESSVRHPLPDEPLAIPA